MIPYAEKRDLNFLPAFSIILIAINVVIFFRVMGSPYHDFLFVKYGLVPGDITFLTLISYAFLHQNIFHLFFNMLFLWIFARSIEGYMGRRMFVCFYFSGILVAAFAYAFMAKGFAKFIPCIGSSGAVSAVMGAYLTLFPNARIKTFFFWGFRLISFEVSALIYLTGWFVLQFFQGANSIWAQYPKTAYWNHVGGFIFGILFAFVIKYFFPRERDDISLTSRRLDE